MIVLNKTKQPWERKDYDIDASNEVPAGDSISTCSLTVECITTPADSLLIVDQPIVASPRMKIWVEGGTNIEKYKITVRISTSAGRRVECEIIIFVKDE